MADRLRMSPRTRRALLAAALGAAVATVASALGRPLSARAADGEVLHVGDERAARTVTKLTNSFDASWVLRGHSTKGGIGVAGSTDHGPGSGQCVSAVRELGTLRADDPGLSGQANTAMESQGFSNLFTGVAGHGVTYGVFGEGLGEASSVGVYGEVPCWDRGGRPHQRARGGGRPQRVFRVPARSARTSRALMATRIMAPLGGASSVRRPAGLAYTRRPDRLCTARRWPGEVHNRPSTSPRLKNHGRARARPHRLVSRRRDAPRLRRRHDDRPSLRRQRHRRTRSPST